MSAAPPGWARIRSGETTSVEETSRFLDQIARHEGDVQAFVSLHHDAMETARQRDAEAARGEPVGAMVAGERRKRGARAPRAEARAEGRDGAEFPGEVVGLGLEFSPHNEEQAWG